MIFNPSLYIIAIIVRLASWDVCLYTNFSYTSYKARKKLRGRLSKSDDTFFYSKTKN